MLLYAGSAAVMTSPTESHPLFLACPSLSKPFAIFVQRVQVNRDPESTASDFQETLDAIHIKWRPNMPTKPRLNGLVERVQQTNLREFCTTADLSLLMDTLNVLPQGCAACGSFKRIYGSMD